MPIRTENILKALDRMGEFLASRKAARKAAHAFCRQPETAINDRKVRSAATGSAFRRP